MVSCIVAVVVGFVELVVAVCIDLLEGDVQTVVVVDDVVVVVAGKGPVLAPDDDDAEKSC